MYKGLSEHLPISREDIVSRGPWAWRGRAVGVQVDSWRITGWPPLWTPGPWAWPRKGAGYGLAAGRIDASRERAFRWKCFPAVWGITWPPARKNRGIGFIGRYGPPRPAARLPHRRWALVSFCMGVF